MSAIEKLLEKSKIDISNLIIEPHRPIDWDLRRLEYAAHITFKNEHDYNLFFQTPGPIDLDGVEKFEGRLAYSKASEYSGEWIGEFATKKDAELYAAVRNALPRLLKEVRELRKTKIGNRLVASIFGINRGKSTSIVLCQQLADKDAEIERLINAIGEHVAVRAKLRSQIIDRDAAINMMKEALEHLVMKAPCYCLTSQHVSYCVYHSAEKALRSPEVKKVLND